MVRGRRCHDWSEATKDCQEYFGEGRNVCLVSGLLWTSGERVIEGVTEGHWRSMAITTGAKRRVFVTKRGRDWSEATPIPDM